MQGCAFAWKQSFIKSHLISPQDTDRPHWHLLRLPILHRITEFKCMLFRKHWGCWPPLPCFLYSLHSFFLCDLLPCILLGTFHPVQQTDSVTESCCSSFVRVPQRLHWDCELTSPRWTPGTSCRATQGDSWAKYATHTLGIFCGKMKEGVTRMRFIHLNKVDHQTDVSAEVLVSGGNAGRQREERS